MNASLLDRSSVELREQGYAIFENAIEPDLVEALVAAIRRIEAESGASPRGNPAEGFATLRTYNLLAKDPIFQAMPTPELQQAAFERVRPFIQDATATWNALQPLSSTNFSKLALRAKPSRPCPDDAPYSIWATDGGGQTLLLCLLNSGN